MGKGAYVLQNLEDKREVQMNIRRMRKAYATPDHLVDHNLCRDEYEIDRILDERIGVSGDVELLVKWRNFNIRSSTWESEDSLQHAPLVLSAWRRTHPPLRPSATLDKRIDNSSQQPPFSGSTRRMRKEPGYYNRLAKGKI